MQILITLVFSAPKTCEFGFPRALTHNDSVQSSTANKIGAEKYLLCGISTSLWAVYDIHIPDITIPINLGATQMDFTLSEMKIANLDVPDLKMNLNANEQADIFLPNVNIQLNFAWKFQQQQYPYVNDHGTGRLNINNAVMSATCKSALDVDCPGHMTIQIIKTTMEYDQLRIKLEGGQSWIFQSLLDVILDSLQNQITDFMSNTLMGGFVGLMNGAFEDGRRQSMLMNNQNIIKDERYVDRVQVGNGYISLMFSGYTYLGSNLKDEYIKSGTSPITMNKFNAEMQMAVKDEAFNNVYYIFHKYYDSYSGKDFKTINQPKLRFTNTGALVTMIVEANGTQVEIELIAKPKLFDDLSKVVGRISFEYQAYSIDTAEGLNAEALLNQVVQHMNEVAEQTGFQYNYALMVDIRDFQPIFDANERVMRLVGDLPQECLPY
ncbi:Conserved_hypothetical protein [Hexamita inflata]|uniref:Lipid-binding serum glycoprotein N-terminal domain-containing protein n=1 Tax=Hexamita inflata TaxID=28002 RepID=A0AA86NMI0_9EUKA|nr:Conserved hypothetical protein [Hexamita inflata]